MERRLNYKQDKMRFDNISKASVKCPCSHTMLIPPNVDRVICTWCHNYVYKNDKTKFIYKLKETMKKEDE